MERRQAMPAATTIYRIRHPIGQRGRTGDDLHAAECDGEYDDLDF
jgi:hypothetical protein